MFEQLHYATIDDTVLIPLGHAILLGIFKTLMNALFGKIKTKSRKPNRKEIKVIL